jgi:hypothetical protein
MFHFTANPRDGMSGSACGTCCCQALSLRPGEANAILIDYAPWIIPFGNGATLVAPLEVQITRDASACSSAPIDGFAPPTNTLRFKLTPPDVQTEIDLTATALPGGNTFEYRVSPLNGPQRGSITPYDGEWNAGVFEYQPEGGFTGTDVVWFDQRDAQGRIYTFPVQMRVTVNSPTVATNMGLSANGQKAVFNPHYYTVVLPISLAPSARPCERYRMDVKATARDCDGNIFTHYSCYEVTPGNC